MRDLLPKDRFCKVGTVFLSVLCALIFGYLFFRYLYRPLLPFLLSFLVALFLEAPVRQLAQKTHMPRGFWSVVCVLAITVLLGVLLWGLLSFGINALRSFSELLSDEHSAFYETLARAEESVRHLLSSILKKEAGSTPLGNFLHEVQTSVLNAAKNYAVGLSSKIPEAVASFAASVPHALLFTGAAVLSCVYFTKDYHKAARLAAKLLPERAVSGSVLFKKKAGGVLLRYLRAYGILALLTFSQLWIGLLLIGIRPALIPALLITVVDVLPVLGSGTVLLPWALISLLSGAIPRGVALIVLYTAVAVVRQIAEPRLVGSAMGQAPLLTLILMYCGLELFGIGGMLLLPAAVNIVTAVHRDAKENDKEPGGGKAPQGTPLRKEDRKDDRHAL